MLITFLDALLVVVLGSASLSASCRPVPSMGDTAPPESVEQLAVSATTGVVASLHADGVFLIQNVTLPGNSQLLTCLTEEGKTVQFSPDGELLALATSHGLVTVWAVKTARELLTIKQEKDEIEALDISQDNKLLVTISRRGEINLWSLSSGNKLASFQADLEQVSSISFSPDGHWFASTTGSGVCLWHVTKQSRERCFPAAHDQINGVAFSASSSLLAASAADGKIYIWNIRQNRLLRKLQVNNEVTLISFVMGTDLLVAIAGGDVKVWQLTNGRVKRTWALGTGAATALSQDGSTLATGSLSSGNIRVLSSTTGEELAKMAYKTK